VVIATWRRDCTADSSAGDMLPVEFAARQRSQSAALTQQIV
jgi:hypothetical protein